MLKLSSAVILHSNNVARTSREDSDFSSAFLATQLSGGSFSDELQLA
jgi:hypothetical protein